MLSDEAKSEIEESLEMRAAWLRRLLDNHRDEKRRLELKEQIEFIEAIQVEVRAL